MLGLLLRNEFKGKRLKGTAIELTNNNNTGAIQIPAKDFLRITYPSHDVLKTIEAAGPNQGRPVVLKGERGQGKSHLMAALYHSFNNNAATQQWLDTWAGILGNEKIREIPLRADMHVISESLHRQRYRFLWDLLFENHPHGSYCRGKWEALGEKKTDIPSDEIILELFKHTPTALILDEFQTWYDGLTNTEETPWRTWAFNFIQVLSEIAKEHPELLVLVVSVRNGTTDAFQQIQRVYPVIVDFKGPSAKHDRLRLLLHRLFENRINVSDEDIEHIIYTHFTEYLRLKNSPPAEHSRLKRDFIEAWPFAPHMIQLLEDQVLMATQAQETRDLIRILADIFKTAEDNPIITAADFRLDDESSGIAALLDSLANQHHAKLREKALRNLEAVRGATTGTSQNLPHLEGVIGALWLRSLTDVNKAGADQETLQVDITKETPVDDNSFSVELTTIVENSFNIHEEGNRYVFKEEENPQSKLIVHARNDKLFQNGEDTDHLRREIRYTLAGNADVPSEFRIIVLPNNWKGDPWTKIEESETPAYWDSRIPLLVVPEPPEKINTQLGEWLRNQLTTKRNVVRFILPRDGSTNIFNDRDVIILSRCVYLAGKWKVQNPEYSRLQSRYEKELREILKTRFDRFAIINIWDFQEPKNCQFHVEAHRAEGTKIPDAVDKQIRENLFIPEDFERFVMQAAPNNESVGKLLKELQEPRPRGQGSIPWLGETIMKERIIRLCAKGHIAINLRGMEYLQKRDGESEDSAWTRMRGKLGSGKHLDETHILLPQNVPASVSSSQTAGEGTPEGLTTQTPDSNDTPIDGQDNSETGNSNGSIFNPGTTRFVPLEAPPTSSLNLLGKIEAWEIKTGTQLKDLRLKVNHLTGAQLQDLIKNLPDGMTYEIGLEKEAE